MAGPQGWWSAYPDDGDAAAPSGLPPKEAGGNDWWSKFEDAAPDRRQADAYVEPGMPAISPPVPAGQQRIPAPIPEPAPFVPQDERGTIGAMGRQVARGAIETVGLVPKGAAALGARLDFNEQDIATATDRYAAADAVARAQMRRDALAQLRDSPGTRDSLLSRFSDIDEGAAVPRPQPVVPIEQRQTFKAGEAVDEFGRTRFPTTRAEDEAFWAGQVPRALGSSAAMIPAMVAGGPLVGGGLVALTGAGEATQAAVDRRRGIEDMIRAGDAPSPDAYPTDRQIASAAAQGLAPGALDAAAIDNLLRPVVRVPGFRGLVTAIAKKAIEQGIVEGTTEGVQQVAQNLIQQFGYNPDQGTLDQVAENVAVGGAVGLLTGGLAGGVMRARARPDQPQTTAAAQQPVPQQETPTVVSRETPLEPAPPATPAAPADLRNREILAPASPPATPVATPEDLRAALDDKRPVAEIRAEREAQAQRDAMVAAVEREAGPEAAAAVTKAMDGAGRRETPMDAVTAADVDVAASQAEQPTPAQADAGNYRKGHVRVQGLDIAIEVPRGGERAGVGSDGRPWSVTMPAHYGYLKAGKDSGDGKVDVFVGDEIDARYAYVIDQIDPATGKFDEPKVMVGMAGRETAAAIYDASYSDGSGPARMGAMTRMTVPELRAWLRDGDPKKPMAYVAPSAAPPAAPVTTDLPARAAPAQNIPQPYPQSSPAAALPLVGQPAAPPSAAQSSPGALPTAVAPRDPLVEVRDYAARIDVRITDAEMIDIRELLADGMEPEDAVEIALTRSALNVASEVEAATQEPADEGAPQVEAKPARGAGAVPAQEGAGEKRPDDGPAAGSAPSGAQPRSSEQGSAKGRSEVEAAQPAPDAAPATPQPTIRKLPDDEALAAMTIKRRIVVEATGETLTLERNAKEALDAAEADVNRYKALLTCLRK